jgi:hypothetical protein
VDLKKNIEKRKVDLKKNKETHKGFEDLKKSKEKSEEKCREVWKV